MRTPLFIAATGLLVLPFCFGCSLDAYRPSLRVQLQGRPGPDLSGFRCVAFSFTSPSTQDQLGPSDVGGLSTTCLGLQGLVVTGDWSTAIGEGVGTSLPKDQYVVKAYGLETSAACNDIQGVLKKTVKIYPIGSGTVDTGAATRLSVAVNYTAATAQDQIAVCRSEIPDHRLFVTHQTYQGNMGGFAGADSHCTDEANALNLGGTWKAILSGDVVNAYDRIVVAGSTYNMRPLGLGGPQKLVDVTDSFWGTLRTLPVGYEADGTPTTQTVWTGTGTSGQQVFSSCFTWTSLNAGHFAKYGDPSLAGPSWIYTGPDGTCNQQRALYCLDGQ